MTAARILLAGALLLALAGCRSEPPSDSGAAAPSIYELESRWQDQRGEIVGLDVWRGQPVALVLFFGSCESTCPVLVHQLQHIEAALPERSRRELRSLLVTIDPDRDTVERLAAYAREQSLPAERWRLLRGDPESVRELAAVVGVRYRPIGDGQFSHSLRITFLDPNGAVHHTVDGVGQPVADVARQVSAWLIR